MQKTTPAPEKTAPTDGLAASLNQIKQGGIKLKSVAASKGLKTSKPEATTDLVAELKAKPIRLRAAGHRTVSGRVTNVPHSDRSGRANGGDAPVGLPGVRNLRKPKPRAEAPREKTEIELVRERMAKKMQSRLQELEAQDVEDSWDEQPDEVSAEAAPTPQAAESGDGPSAGASSERALSDQDEAAHATLGRQQSSLAYV